MGLTAILNLLAAVVVWIIISSALSLVVSAPFLLLRRYRRAKQASLCVAFLWLAGSIVNVGLWQIETYPIGSAKLFLTAAWMAVMATGPLLVIVGIGFAAKRASGRDQSQRIPKS